MNVCQSLTVTAQLLGDREAVVFEGRRWTYEQTEAASVRAAQMLAQLGVRRGDRVAMVVSNVPAFIVWYYAILRLGAIAVSISTRLQSEEVAFIVEDCGAAVVIATTELRETATATMPRCVGHVLVVSEDGRQCDGRSLPEPAQSALGSYVEMQPDDPATILYTSGTTGFPKGATLSHRNVRATVHAFNHLCRMQSDDRLLLGVPLFHCYGQNALLNAGMNVGATIVLQRRFDLNESKRLIAAERVTKLFGVPTTFKLLLASCSPAELPEVDYCFSAAATLPIQISRAWLAKFGMPIYEGYGLTETAPFASYNHRIKYVAGSLGTPVDLVEMKVVDPETGRACPPHEPGEIAIRGPNVMLGYWNRPEETAAAIRDGWFYSGDIGRTDQQGYFYIVDRLKDMIAVGGQKVFPAEVERVLLDHPEVDEAAVVGLPEETFGEKVVACIVGDGDDTAAGRIREFCRQHLAPYKVPVEIQFLDALPRNPAGKVLKTQLRDPRFLSKAAAGDARESSASSPETTGNQNNPSDAEGSGDLIRLLEATYANGRAGAVTEHLLAEMRELLGGDAAPAAEASFIDAGMDSLMIVELRDRLQRQVGSKVELAATMVFDYPTPGQLARYLVEALQSPPNSPSRPGPKTTEAFEGKRRPGRPQPAVEAMSEEAALDALLRELDE